jgi:hypothetical protein
VSGACETESLQDAPGRDPRDRDSLPPPECGRSRRATVVVGSEEPIVAASFVLGIEDGAGLDIRDLRVAGGVPAGTVRSFSSDVDLDPAGVLRVSFALELSRPLPPAIAADLVEMEVVAPERDSTLRPRRFFTIAERSSGLSVERRLGMVVVDPRVVEGSVTVVPDIRPPALYCPPPITVPCSGPEGALVEYEVSAADACDPDPAVSCDIGSGRVFPAGTTTVACTARDSSGNTARYQFDVTVTCTIDGGLQLPGDCNQDGSCDLSDAVCLLGFLFLGSSGRLPCGDGRAESPSNLGLLDFNGDARLDITDGIAKLSFLFVGGPPHVLGRTCVSIPGCEDACSR